jgi:chromosome segregation ATPase
MPKVTRSPPPVSNILATNLAIEKTPVHYASDSELNLTSTGSENLNITDNITKRAKRRLTDTPGSFDDFLCEFKQMFENLRSYQESKFIALSTSISTLIEQNTEFKKSIDIMSSQYDTLVDKVATLKSDNQQYKTHIKSLESKIDMLERDSKTTSVELRNIPKLEQENKESLYQVVKTLASIIGSIPGVQDSEIREIYRMKNQAIVVNFTTSSRKENLVQKFKEVNKEKRQSSKSPIDTSTLTLPAVSFILQGSWQKIVK